MSSRSAKEVPRGADNVKTAPVHVAEVHVSTGLLFDLVVLAGGDASKMNPLCQETAKPMLPLGNRPLIWYVLKPWIDRGVRCVFLCTHDYAATSMGVFLEQAFPTTTFKWVEVPAYHRGSGHGADGDDGDNDDDHAAIPTTTCEAVRCYYELKKSLRIEGTPEGQHRDALFLSGDTILADVDVEPFINNFYSSFAAAGVLLWKPLDVKSTAIAPSTSAGASGAAAKGGAGKPAKGATAGGPGVAALRAHTYDFTAVGIDTLDDVHVASHLSSSTSTLDKSRGAGASVSGQLPLCDHHRLHFIAPFTSDTKPTVSIGFAARRPNMTWCADVVDVHVYLLRAWVVEFVASVAAKDGAHPHLDSFSTLKADVLPLLARSQHALINKREGVFLNPFQRLKVDKNISAGASRWALDTRDTRCVGSLNAARPTNASHACVESDSLRVVCTIYHERKGCSHAIRRVHNKENYLSLHHEALQTLRQPSTRDGSLCSSAAKDNTDNVSTIGAMLVAQFDEDHRRAMGQAVDVPESHVVQSLVRTVPHDRVYITCSVVGQRVSLGKDCRIVNSVIADDVELHDGACVVDSVVSCGAQVSAGVRVSGSFVGPQALVSENVSDTVHT